MKWKRMENEACAFMKNTYHKKVILSKLTISVPWAGIQEKKATLATPEWVLKWGVVFYGNRKVQWKLNQNQK